MDVYSSWITQMSDARTNELRRQAERHAVARAVRTERASAVKARFRGWTDRRRTGSAPAAPVIPVLPPPAVGDAEELRRSA